MPACPSVTRVIRGTRDKLKEGADLGRGAGGTIEGKTTKTTRKIKTKITFQRQPELLPRKGMCAAVLVWSGITIIPPVLSIGKWI